MACHTLYVARHGETDWNAAGRWQGHTDIPLNDHGRAQARALAEAVRAHRLAGIVASDLVRAVETARIVAAELGVALSYTDPDLRERAFGVFEGLTRSECERLHGEAWRGWLEERRVPHGGEQHEALVSRVAAALGRLVVRMAPYDAPALVVSHGGTIRAMVMAATGAMPPPLKNGSLWRLEWDAGLVSAEPLQ